MAEYDIEPYNEETGKGCVRHIYTRTGESGKMVCIVTNTEKLPFADELVAAFNDAISTLCR